MRRDSLNTKSHAAFLCRGPTLRASGEKVKSRQPNFVGSEDLGKCEGHHLQPYSLKKHLHLSIMLLPDSAPVGKRGHFASVFPKIDLESASSNSRFINGRYFSTTSPIILFHKAA